MSGSGSTKLRSRNKGKSKASPSTGASTKPQPEQTEAIAQADTSKKGTIRFSLWNIWVGLTLLRVLLFDSYHSTDFDVHRNWLAITHNLPLKDWYIEATSQWTLDYPPFFAYFEWFLSQLVPPVVKADGCLDIVEVGQYGWPTVVFQRTTVIISEILLFAVLQTYINMSSKKTLAFIIALSLVMSPGLFIVDHIHFQYNGMLFGILCAVILCARHRKHYLLAFFFAVLLCFKHIFLYLAPAVFVYLLRAECLDFKQKNLIKMVKWTNLIKLGGIVISVFTVAFAPFVYYGVMPQLLARLFPFSRGLMHAYWAPNIWAIYAFVDKILVTCLRLPYLHTLIHRFVPIPSPEITSQKLTDIGNTGTRGLVQDVYFVILPNITPRVAFLLTLFYDILSVLPLLINPTFKRFVGALTLTAFSSFLFGWHVHEKAVMLIIFPFTFLITERRLLNCFMVLAGAGYVSLFPLTPGEEIIKYFYTFAWFVICSLSFNEVSNERSFKSRVFLFDRISIAYILGLIPMVLTVYVMQLFKDKFAILQKFEFVGLMIYSVYCGIGVISSWLGLTWLYFFEDILWEDSP
ncbi:CYFA0S01e08548g1_1 [Cyberlindnera fabianii]|uniref:Alpha-1,3-glucosyltransferase n=1 Tax=Cyberlindnera fabianii TaxID=36022 RepID=A0A061APB3_CYBFA|nr:CYFA0S01e08548g1_1 [Cyberlindnera fabianii]